MMEMVVTTGAVRRVHKAFAFVHFLKRITGSVHSIKTFAVFAVITGKL